MGLHIEDDRIAQAGDLRAGLGGLLEYVDHGRRRPVLDSRTGDEIIGYDDDGIPR
ncbi:hypothetical protein [Arsenicicoccus sp. UBA7492]|uniref:hypothetical protein n=1 Tax=Arsenicicoccus sp. UBA7492 TaxID=1946057 RepID=UPI00257D274A|nr:hypothetical protein [Arsenicicoccus sp. UBA7492]